MTLSPTRKVHPPTARRYLYIKYPPPPDLDYDGRYAMYESIGWISRALRKPSDWVTQQFEQMVNAEFIALGKSFIRLASYEHLMARLTKEKQSDGKPEAQAGRAVFAMSPEEVYPDWVRPRLALDTQMNWLEGASILLLAQFTSAGMEPWYAVLYMVMLTSPGENGTYRMDDAGTQAIAEQLGKQEDWVRQQIEDMAKAKLIGVEGQLVRFVRYEHLIPWLEYRAFE